MLDQELDVLELREINVHTLKHAGYGSRLLAGAVMFVRNADRFTKNSAVVIQAAVTQMRLDFNGQHSCKTKSQYSVTHVENGNNLIKPKAVEVDGAQLQI